MNNKLLTGVTFIDFSKAFDTVDHSILVRKLDLIGIRGKSLEWAKDYLTNRKQKTKANNTISSEREISYGVPQGSVLGPLLFIIYINDLEDWLQTDKLQLYADDTVMYAEGKTEEEVIDQLNTTLERLNNWCEANKITINVRKSKTLSSL